MNVDELTEKQLLEELASRLPFISESEARKLAKASLALSHAVHARCEQAREDEPARAVRYGLLRDMFLDEMRKIYR